MTLVCGVKKAGRGPVVGPLVVCGVVIEEKDEPKLLSLGTKDSKLLTPKTRERLFGQVKEMVKKHKLIIIPPEEIDKAVGSHDHMNLNWQQKVVCFKINHFLLPVFFWIKRKIDANFIY